MRAKKEIARWPVLRLAAGALVLASACTFVNGFDDVKPYSGGTYQAVDASSTVDAAFDGGPNPPLAAAIVLGGQVDVDGAASSILTVLDPHTGRELGAREPMVVAGIRYDGLRDLWYVFESKTTEFATGPTDEVILHARLLEVATGRWTEVGSSSVPSLQSYDSIVVVRDRLLYVAHAPDAGATGAVDLVTVDTTNPSAMTVLDRQGLDRAPRGMIGTRNVTGPGGVVGLVRVGAGADGCGETGNCIEVVRVRVPNAGAPVVDPPIGLAPLVGFGVPSFASMASLDKEVLVFPRASNDASAPSSAFLYEPRTQALDGIASSFVIKDSLLRRAAVSECDRQVFLVGANTDLDVHSVPLLGNGTGAPTSASTGHSGTSVYYEPMTKTVLSPFSQGPGYDLSAFRWSGSAAAPVLTKRTTADWNPPGDLRPILLGVREPVPIVCP